MKNILTLVAFAGVLSGCASMVVTDEKLQQRTAFALGLDVDSFTIANRSDEGIRTDYSVKTKSGQSYNCYMTGIFSFVGPAVSDAICSKPGERPRNPLTGQ